MADQTSKLINQSIRSWRREHKYTRERGNEFWNWNIETGSSEVRYKHYNLNPKIELVSFFWCPDINLYLYPIFSPHPILDWFIDAVFRCFPTMENIIFLLWLFEEMRRWICVKILDMEANRNEAEKRNPEIRNPSHFSFRSVWFSG